MQNPSRNYLNPTEIVRERQAAKHNNEPEDVAIRSELRQLLHLGKKYLWADPKHRMFLQQHGLNIEPARFYSQLPTVSDIETSFEYGEQFIEHGPYASIFDASTMKGELAAFAEFAHEFDPPLEGQSETPSSYYWNNPAFSFCDALSYWCAIRRYQPNRVVEIGSGFSSLIARDALSENGHGELILIEPYPMSWLRSALPKATLIEKPVQEFSPEEFDRLFENGDILFIDSTHTVKIGSDCLALYLRLLPKLSSSVHVHVHDICLPFPIPKKRAHLHVHWAEQYLLLAYLLENNRTSVTYGSAAGVALFPELMKQFMDGKYPPGGGSFWFDQAGTASG